jgi:putative addiction module killer protein
MNALFEIREYVEDERSPFAGWFDGLDSVTAARVDRYIRRLESGNFGAAKALREGVSELRLDFGPGCRVYFGRDGKTIILLLGGGSKRRQGCRHQRRDCALAAIPTGEERKTTWL